MPAPERSIVGILLAAGNASRYGSDKLLARLADGQPLAVASACNLLAACERALAVVGLGSSAALCDILREAGCEVHVAADAARGMGRSLAAGVAAAHDAAGWLVALADMPAIRPDSTRRVADALRAGASIAAPYHAGRRGHPVGFAREWFGALSRLDGDAGGRSLLATHSDRITRVEVEDAGVLLDVDAPADLMTPAVDRRPS